MSAERPYSIHALELGPMENFIYLIQDHASGRAAVVDPAWEVPEISHQDHINGIEGVLEASDAQLHLLRPEAEFWGRHLDLPTLHHGGDRIRVGATEIEVLHTPGHTPGSACYRIGDDLITGDTLFVYGCGRCDLRGGDPEQMFHTLNDLLHKLPADTCIHPGHNYSVAEVSTLREQIEGNPFLHFDDLKRFTHYRMHYHDRHRQAPYGPVPKGQEMVDA